MAGATLTWTIFGRRTAGEGATTPPRRGRGGGETGRIPPKPRFPDMKGLADYVHGKGMKIGLYSSPGPTTCGGCTASYQHEEQDAMTWAKWGFDYIKYDLCSYTRTPEGRANGGANASRDNAMKPYIIMGEALKKVDR